MTDLARKEIEDVAVSRLKYIADDSLTCIEKVAESAEAALRGPRGGSPSSFTNVNTFMRPDQVRKVIAIRENERNNLHELLRQPVIARVGYVDEDGNADTLFITRTTPPSIPSV